MKILIVDTYYDKFLKTIYKKYPQLKNNNYKNQISKLLASSFGTSDSYSYFLKKNKVEAKELIVNCLPLQKSGQKKII